MRNPGYVKKLVLAELERSDDLHENWDDLLVLLHSMSTGVRAEDGKAVADGSNGDRLAKLVDSASSDPLAWDACVALVENLTARGEPLPRPLAGLALASLRGEAHRSAKPGQTPTGNLARDWAIRRAVWTAIEAGAKPYARTNGACRIVKECLETKGVYLSVWEIETIWKNRPFRDEW